MEKFKCPNCGNEDLLPKNVEKGGRFTCPNCYSQFNTYHEGKKRIIHCALGTKEDIECNAEIEKPLPKKKKHGFLDIRTDID